MTDNTKNEISITRIFDAPRELVWKEWTEPEMFKKWWGPKDFTAPVIKIDFRVGGNICTVCADLIAKTIGVLALMRK